MTKTFKIDEINIGDLVNKIRKRPNASGAMEFYDNELGIWVSLSELLYGGATVDAIEINITEWTETSGKYYSVYNTGTSNINKYSVSCFDTSGNVCHIESVSDAGTITFISNVDIELQIFLLEL